MGSFDVGCGISNLTIGYGDKIGFLVLDENRFIKYANQGNAYHKEGSRPFFVYNTDLLKPVFPPIFGVYNDYGSITKIKKSITTELMEKIYRRSIEQIMECIGCDRDVYSTLSETFKHYFPEDKTFAERAAPKDAGIISSLIDLGFTMEHDNETESKFLFPNFSLTHSKEDNKWVIGSLDKWNRYPKAINNPSTLKTLMNEVSAATGSYPGFKVEDYMAIKSLHRMSGMFFLKDVFEGMKKYRKNPETRSTDYFSLQSRRSNDWGEFLTFIKENGINDLWQKNFRTEDYFKENLEFPREFYNLLPMYEDSKEFDLLSDMREIMNSLNRMFIPSFTGEQYGNNEASAALNSITDKILAIRYEDSL